MKLAIDGHNKTLDESRAHFKIKLNGIGLHCGAGLLIDKSDVLYGETFRRAYHIGEDVCCDGKILVSHDLRDRLRPHPAFQAATFEEWDGDPHEPCCQIVGAQGLRSNLDVAYGDGDLLKHAVLVQLASRHAPEADLEEIDGRIEASSMNACAVLMFSLDLSPATATDVYPDAADHGGSVAGVLATESVFGPIGSPSSQSRPLEELMAQKFRDLGLLEPALEAYGGRKVEDMLWIFDSPSDAVMGAVEARRLISIFNASPVATGSRCRVSGWGVHLGNILFVKGTDVHWGDPVNTASKLGQDCATNGQILISPPVKDHVENGGACAMLTLKEELFNRSGVELQCFSVMRPGDPPA